jgi:hypothetical protein
MNGRHRLVAAQPLGTSDVEIVTRIQGPVPTLARSRDEARIHVSPLMWV